MPLRPGSARTPLGSLQLSPDPLDGFGGRFAARREEKGKGGAPAQGRPEAYPVTQIAYTKSYGEQKYGWPGGFLAQFLGIEYSVEYSCTRHSVSYPFQAFSY